MADTKLASTDPIDETSPVSKPKNRDVPRSRSERKDKSKSSGSVSEVPAGPPRKLEFGEAKAYSPRNIDPSNPFVAQQVPQRAAAYEEMQGVETEGEATQRHNEEAEAEKAAASTP